MGAMESCVFCRIVKGELPATVVFESGSVIAFDDIHPMAPVHVIIIPKRHIATLMGLDDKGLDIMRDITRAAQEVARKKGVDARGFRMAINCNKEGGQLIFHLHAHLLGGEQLDDRMG
jgi:histidine triad (HIT) family protein